MANAGGDKLVASGWSVALMWYPRRREIQGAVHEGERALLQELHSVPGYPEPRGYGGTSIYVNNFDDEKF